MTQYKKRAVLIALSLTLITVFIVLLTLLTPEIPVCPETTGTIERTEFYEDQNGNWIREDLSWNIGKDISAIRITDLNDLNRIAAVNYVPDRFVVPGTLPQDAAIVPLDQPFDFASDGTLIFCVLSPDPFANDFLAQTEALDRYKIGDYWTFSFLIPNVFNASNIYYDNQLVACNGEIENYEFIRFNTSDDRVTVEHRAQTEPIRITLKFYTRREALSDHYITIHYQSNGTLSGIGDMPLIGTESRILSVQKQAPVVFLVALILCAMTLAVLLVLSALKQSSLFLPEIGIVAATFLLFLSGYCLASSTSTPLWHTALQAATPLIVSGAAALSVARRFDKTFRIPVLIGSLLGFAAAFSSPYLPFSAAAVMRHIALTLQIVHLLAILVFSLFPQSKRTPPPRFLNIICALSVAGAVTAGLFLKRPAVALSDPALWLLLFSAATVFVVVLSVFAKTERENAYITANLNAEVERQIKDVKAVIAERDNLLQFVSHDLKKPLRSGETHLNTLLERETDAEQIKLLNIVKQNNARVLSNLTEIASYAKFNYIAEPSCPTDLNKLCQRLYRLCAEDCNAAGITLCNLVGETVKVFAKPQGLENALTNLIFNAIEHAACTEIVISARTEKNKVLLTVKDNGKGIDPAIDVFRPYVSENKPDEGGLGLYLCKNIVESMNGTLTYVSENGAAFTVSLLRA